MDSTLDIYMQALRDGTDPQLTDDQLDAMAQSYPWFALPFATAAASERDPQRRARLMERVALVAADRDMLFRLMDPDGARFAHFYPDETAATPDTDSAIDTFLNTYGRRDPREEALLERLIFNPVADYSAVLEKEAQEQLQAPAATPSQPEPGSQDALLDAFLADRSRVAAEQPEVPTAPPARDSRPHHAPAPAADSSLSESLAKIYIRQGRYDKAYEIIHQLSLNFPKKSIYFADQLRFLKKLIRNRQFLDNRK